MRPLVPLVFHNLPSLYPPSFRRNDFFILVRNAFMLDLRRELGDRFEHFQSPDSYVKSSYVLGSEAWEDILVGC